MRKQYFISGLGANEEAFEKLEDFGTQKIMIQWIKNEKNESLKEYALRIIEKYGIEKGDVLVGLSFGGLIAQQIAEILDLDSVIMISSFRTKKDLRGIFRLGIKLNLYKLIPTFRVPLVTRIIVNFLNSGTKDSRPLIKSMLNVTDMHLVKWSIRKIVEQKESIAPKIRKYNLIGSKDRILSNWDNELTYNIKGGSHFMVYEKSEEVSKIIKEIMSEDSIGL